MVRGARAARVAFASARNLRPRRARSPQSLFGFGSGKGDRITVNFAGSDVRPTKRISGDASTGPAVPVFASGEPVKGMVTIEVTPGKRMEHLGIKIELVGQIEMFYDRGNFHDFTSLVRELDAVRARARRRGRHARPNSPDSRAPSRARAGGHSQRVAQLPLRLHLRREALREL